MCLGAQKNHLIETVLLSTSNICFGWEIRKWIFYFSFSSEGLSVPSLILHWQCKFCSEICDRLWHFQPYSNAYNIFMLVSFLSIYVKSLFNHACVASQLEKRLICGWAFFYFSYLCIRGVKVLLKMCLTLHAYFVTFLCIVTWTIYITPSNS